MNNESRGIQHAIRRAGTASRALLEQVKDPQLGTNTKAGLTLRRLLYDLIDQYKTRTEQLLWAKWDLGKKRNELKRAFAELEASRVEFATYLLDIRGEELDQRNPRAGNATVRELVTGLLQAEREFLAQVREALRLNSS